jgi:hypothetical protein
MRLAKIATTMPSYFLPYPKPKPKHVKQKPLPQQTTQTAKHPYPHPQPDPPNDPPSPLNLSSPSGSSSPSASSPASSSSSSSSTIKPTSRSQHWKQDYSPSILKLQIVCGDPHDPSLVVVFGLKFREGRRPKVRFSVKRGHGKTRELVDALGLRDDGKEERKEGDKVKEARGKKRKRESEN